MTKQPPKNTDKELLARAAANPYPDDYDPDGSDVVIIVNPEEERAWYKRRGLPMPEEYQKGYDPLDEDDRREGWVEENKFKAVRIISPKNAKYSN